MLLDAASRTASDIGRRWSHKPRSLSTYRKRPLAAGLISSIGRGKAAFADPTVRRYIEAQAAAEGFTDLHPGHRAFPIAASVIRDLGPI